MAKPHTTSEMNLARGARGDNFPVVEPDEMLDQFAPDDAQAACD